MLSKASLSFSFSLLLLFSFVSLPQTARAQNVYELKYKTDIPIGTIGVGSLLTSYFLNKRADTLTADDILLLKSDDIWKFDRSATKRWSPKAAIASDVLLYTSMASPGLLFINSNVRHERYTSLLYLETMVLTAGLTNLVKGIVKRTRPYAYNTNPEHKKKITKDTRFSFFSGHTSLTASSAVFLAKVYSDLNPDSRLKPLVWTSAFVLPAVVGFLRYYAGKHYPMDIIVGYGVGAATGFFVPYIHKRVELRP